MPRAGVQLCYPYEEKRLMKWRPPFAVQPKLNGERCRAIVDSECHVTLLSSEEHIRTSVPHINAAIATQGFCNIELDGELYIHGKPLQDIHSIVSRTVDLHPDYQSVEYHIFDVVSAQPQKYRFNQLFAFNAVHPPLYAVKAYLAYTTDDITEYLNQFLSQGYEGIIIRNLDAAYTRKRSTNMMKFKPRAEDIYQIIGSNEEISISGEEKGSLGALVCVGNDGTIFRVGSGPALTRDARRSLWAERDQLVGKYARVKYQTHSKSGTPMHSILVEVLDDPLSS